MKILFIKGDEITNVRLSKFLEYFQNKKCELEFWGWDRSSRNIKNPLNCNCKYLLSGGGLGSRILLIYYPIWMFVVFLKLLLTKTEGVHIIAVNFDSALPVYMASVIRRFSFYYEIRDEFSLSYSFPTILRSIIQQIDHTIMRKSTCVIHVDSNRVNYDKCKSIVIENSPNDILEGKERIYNNVKNIFAVIGNISSVRGIDSIYEFAKNNKSVGILLVGKFYNEKYRRQFLSLDNVEYYDYMPQKDLFPLLMKCCAIFSLYDPKLEINRLAASNKVYDAMMLGIPVITNEEVINSKFIEEQKIGLIVNYQYDNSWNILAEKDFYTKVIELGTNGRKLYLEKYQFSCLIEQNLLPILTKNETNYSRPKNR